jgi:hypothetical protein
MTKLTKPTGPVETPSSALYATKGLMSDVWTRRWALASRDDAARRTFESSADVSPAVHDCGRLLAAVSKRTTVLATTENSAM